LEGVETLLAYDLESTDLSAEVGFDIPVEEGQALITLTESPVFLIAEQTGFWDKLSRQIQAEFEKLQEGWESRLEDWWAQQQTKFEAWWAETQRNIEREIEVWLEEELERMVEGTCSAAYLPLFASTLVLLLRRSES
jgi:hypothetical protein